MHIGRCRWDRNGAPTDPDEDLILQVVARAHKVSERNGRAPLKLPYAIVVTESKRKLDNFNRMPGGENFDEEDSNYMSFNSDAFGSTFGSNFNSANAANSSSSSSRQYDHVNIGGYYRSEPEKISTKPLFADDEELEYWDMYVRNPAKLEIRDANASHQQIQFEDADGDAPKLITDIDNDTGALSPVPVDDKTGEMLVEEIIEKAEQKNKEEILDKVDPVKKEGDSDSADNTNSMDVENQGDWTAASGDWSESDATGGWVDSSENNNAEGTPEASGGESTQGGVGTAPDIKMMNAAGGFDTAMPQGDAAGGGDGGSGGNTPEDAGGNTPLDDDGAVQNAEANKDDNADEDADASLANFPDKTKYELLNNPYKLSAAEKKEGSRLISMVPRFSVRSDFPNRELSVVLFSNRYLNKQVRFHFERRQRTLPDFEREKAWIIENPSNRHEVQEHAMLLPEFTDNKVRETTEVQQ
jgi:hypothetical protein